MATQKLSKPQITASLCRCNERKYQPHKVSLFNPSLFDNFRRNSNRFRGIINTIKKNYHHNLFELATDMKIIQSRNSSAPHFNRANPKLNFKVNDELVTNSSDIAPTFKCHFSCFAKVLNAKIPSLPDDATKNEKIVK